MQRSPLVLFAVLGTWSLGLCQSPKHMVVPAHCDPLGGGSHFWLPGGSADLRQQTIVGASHLTALVGRTLTALEWRRKPVAEAYAGGQATWTITLSTAANAPLRCSHVFAANIGPNPTQVFSGPVTFPASSAAAGAIPAWSPATSVRVVFTTPFVYLGGPLCIDIVGQPIAGMHTGWWVADAAFDSVSGSQVERSTGCGSNYAQGRWMHVANRDLVPGGHPEFVIGHTPGSPGLVLFGPAASQPVPLPLLGVPAPGCNLGLAGIDTVMPVLFTPMIPPPLAAYGEAWVHLWIPDSPAMFGATVATQSFHIASLTSSNTIEWTVASAFPQLDMASIDGVPASPDGHLSTAIAHVLRIEHQ